VIKAELIIENQRPWVDEKFKPMVLTLKGCGFYYLQPFCFYKRSIRS
jgi:hypothetical protein